MSEHKHAPGPWGICQTETGQRAIFNADGIWIAATLRKKWPVEDTANARLIAAAPELLDVLVDALDLVDEIDSAVRAEHRRNGAPHSKSIAGVIADRARAAIAKATGTQP